MLCRMLFLDEENEEPLTNRVRSPYCKTRSDFFSLFFCVRCIQRRYLSSLPRSLHKNGNINSWWDNSNCSFYLRISSHSVPLLYGWLPKPLFCTQYICSSSQVLWINYQPEALSLSEFHRVLFHLLATWACNERGIPEEHHRHSAEGLDAKTPEWWKEKCGFQPQGLEGEGWALETRIIDKNK